MDLTVACFFSSFNVTLFVAIESDTALGHAARGPVACVAAWAGMVACSRDPMPSGLMVTRT
jgi:hypothetical protein